MDSILSEFEADIEYTRAFDFSKFNQHRIISENTDIFTKLMSDLDAFDIQGILFFWTRITNSFQRRILTAQSFPVAQSDRLQSLTRALLHPKSKIKIDANALDFFPVICRTRSNDPVETQGEVKDTLILSRAFGPNGRSGTFALRLTEADTKLDEEDLEQVQNCIQSAFFKLVTNQMKMEKTINLTPREKEIVKWITRGKSNPDIAQIIGISIHTVNGYLRGIYLKTQTGDRVSLSFFALHHGLIA